MSLPISNTEYVYRQLRRRIITGELAPGERLIIRGLCEQFGTSNSPVIEAIRRLEQEGLITSRQNAGAQVTEWNAQDVVRSFLTREVNDGLAAQLFVECATAKEQDQLVQLNESYHQAAQTKDAIRVREADTNYHLHIICCTFPMPMQKAMESTYAITMTHYSNHATVSAQFREDTHDELTDIYLGDDPEIAARAASEHVRGALSHVVRMGILRSEDVPVSIALETSSLVDV